MTGGKVTARTRSAGGRGAPDPAVGFFLRGHVHGHDVRGYMAAQVIGALGAAAVFVAALGGSATHVHTRLRRPRRTSPPQPRSASKPG